MDKRLDLAPSLSAPLPRTPADASATSWRSRGEPRAWVSASGGAASLVICPAAFDVPHALGCLDRAALRTGRRAGQSARCCDRG